MIIFNVLVVLTPFLEEQRTVLCSSGIACSVDKEEPAGKWYLLSPVGYPDPDLVRYYFTGSGI